MSLMAKRVYDSSVQLFSLKTLQDVLDVNNTRAFFRIADRLAKGGVLIKIERNKYILKNYSGSEFSLANFIYQPSYVSFESALSHLGILPQFPYEVTSATIKQTCSKKFNEREYGYYHVKKELFWGYNKINNYLIAEPEKALLDQVYSASKGIKKTKIDEYDFSKINRSKLKLYIDKFPKTRQFARAVANVLAEMKV